MSTPPVPDKRYTYEWYVVALCMVAYIFSFVDRQILALLVEPIKADLQLTDTQFSLLHGLAFSLFYASMGIPLAYLADKFSRPLIISIGVFFWSLATALCGISKNFLHMFLARMGVGIGEAALSPATYSMLSDYFPRDKLGRAVGVYSIGSFIGAGMAFLIGGYVINLVSTLTTVEVPFFGTIRPWQLTFFIVGLPGILVALLIGLTVREPPRRGVRIGADGKTSEVSFVQTLVFLKKHRVTFFYHYIGYSFYAMVMYSLLGWLPAFYMRNFGLTATQVGYILGTLVLIANVGGVVFAGWLNDRFYQRGRIDAPMRAGAIGAGIMILPIILFPLMENLWLSLALLTPAMFFVSFPMPTSTAAMQMLAPNQMRAQVAAIFLLVSNLIGLAIGATLVALVTDKIFGYESAVGYSLAIVGGVAAILATLLLGLGCRAFRASMAAEGQR